MTTRCQKQLSSNSTRHPVGNGIPGPQNWSGTDNATIREVPLGGHPDLVKWSVSAVLTPHGWVGRVDNHITQTTAHIEVFPQAKDAYNIFKNVNRSAVEDDLNADLYLVMAQSRFTDEQLYDLGMDYTDMADYLEYCDANGSNFAEMYADLRVPDHIILRELEKANGPYETY